MGQKRDQLLRYAYQSIGVPYQWGGDDLRLGIDCSGFARLVLQKFDLLPAGDYSSQMLFDYFQERGVQTKELRPGNVIFFGRSAWQNNGTIYCNKVRHVALVIDHCYMIEVGGGNSLTRSLASALANHACVKVSRLIKRSDKVAIIDPFMRVEE